MQHIDFAIPAHYQDEAFKHLMKCKRNIFQLDWSFGEPYYDDFIHATPEGLKHMTHKVVRVSIDVPEENDWYLVATVKEGALFVVNHKEKLELRNGHGSNYHICDFCHHHQRKMSYIIRNRKTDEEKQVGSECARTFGINMLGAIYKLTHELYERYSLPFTEDPYEERFWPQHISDPYATCSIETSVIVQAAKAYYDKNNGVWKKGYYDDYTHRYYPSESAADIRSSLDSFEPDAENAFYKELAAWLREQYPDTDNKDWSEFDQSMAAIGTCYYMSVSETAAAFFAIKNYERWKRERDAREKGIYLPKRGDYIQIQGRVVDSIKRVGYYGSYYEYQIYNDLDKRIYKRAGAVPSDEDGNVKGYAYIEDVFGSNVTLQRITKHPKKGVEINNILTPKTL